MNGTDGGRTGGGWSALVRRALGGHAAVGLLAAGLLYVVALTGTLAVIHERWERWERPDVPELAALPPAAVQAAVTAALDPAAGPRSGLIAIQFPTDDLPRATITTDAGTRYLDHAGRAGARVSTGWAAFVVTLHESLLLPVTWGYALVGALGVSLASLALTGVLAHPRITRDAFRLRWRQGAPIARVDWHNRLGVWTLPFTVAVAMTGAVLGLSTIGFAALADAYGGGRLERVYAPLFGGQPVPDARPAPVPDVAAALASLRARAPWARPAFVTVPAPGTRGQAIQVLTVHPRRLIYGETYLFDARGRPRGRVGLSDGAIGQQVAASAYGLHFGSYGGLPVELAYLLFGTALCVVVATGPSIWLGKRRRRGLAEPRLAACWTALVWGVPFLLLLAAWLALAGGGVGLLPYLFWPGLAALVAAAALRPGRFGSAACRTVVLASAALTGVGHLLVVQPAATGSRLIDVALALGAGAAWWAMARVGDARRRWA